MSSTAIFGQIFDLMRLLQRANRYIVDDLGTGLGIVETFLLVEIDSAITCSAKELATTLQLDKSVISRHLARLETDGFISIGRTKLDKRASIVSLNLKGKKFLEKYDELSNQNLEEKLPRITSSELRVLIDGFRVMSDQLNAGAGKLRSNDHPARVEFRRFTRAIGVMRKSFMHSNLNSAQWQVLAEAQDNSSAHALKDMALILGISASTISSIAKALELKGYVQRRSVGPDSRQTSLQLTSAGQQVLKLISKNGEELIRKGLISFDSDKVDEFKTALAKFVAADDNSRGLKSSSSIVEIAPFELANARAFLVENLVLYRQHLNLSGALLLEDSYCFACYENQTELQGVIEFRKIAGKVKLLHFVMSPRVQQDKAWSDFIAKAIELLKIKSGVQHLYVDSEHAALKYLELTYKNVNQENEVVLAI